MNQTTTKEQQPRLRARASSSRSTSPVRPAPYKRNTSGPHPPASSSSAWQQLMVHAGSAAGTTAAVHIEHQMTLLRNFLVSLATTSSNTALTATRNQDTSQSILSTIKKDMVDTLRKVVDVISRYAGACLPQSAKAAVRNCILNLPNRWATVSDIRSTATSPANSPMLRPAGQGMQTPAARNGQEEKAIRLLAFGQESVDMLQSVSTVFSDTVDRAEIWLERLRSVRGGNNTERPEEITHRCLEESVQLPPIRNLNSQHQSDPERKNNAMPLDH